MPNEIQNGDDSPYMAGDADRLDAAIKSETLPLVAKVQFRCPTEGRSFIIGPDDYIIHIPLPSRGREQKFLINVNCPCGQKHNLVTEY